MQASEDAKSIIEKERQEAQAEVEAARATALRCQQALEEQAHSLSQAEQEVENQSLMSYSVWVLPICSVPTKSLR